jgi:hypothetical protein
MDKDIRYITFGCSESIHLYKWEGGYNPAHPYKAHNDMDEARTYLTNRGVKDIKIVEHYERKSTEEIKKSLKKISKMIDNYERGVKELTEMMNQFKLLNEHGKI